MPLSSSKRLFFFFYSTWRLFSKVTGSKCLEQLMWSSQPQMTHPQISACIPGSENIVAETEIEESENQVVYCEIVIVQPWQGSCTHGISTRCLLKQDLNNSNTS